jgi:hypothetical protein
MKILLTFFSLFLSISLIAQVDVDIPLKSTKDQVILDDMVVNGSLGVGLDIVNGESFGFSTIKLKENNTRIKFDDTSTSASFPRNDWTLEAHSSSNGGTNQFAILDDTHSRTPFKVMAGAKNNALLISADGRLGLGTAPPNTAIHLKTDDTPTLRLEQDGTSGWTPQVWDMGSNESNFFIKDVTNGSKRILKIANGAPEDAFYIANSGNVGIGTATPQSKLAVNGTVTCKELKVEAAGWPDYVFADSYKLRSLKEVESHIKEHKHLPGVPSEKEILEEGVKLGEMNAILLEKIEELTLYMIELKKENDEIKSQLNKLQQ